LDQQLEYMVWAYQAQPHSVGDIHLIVVHGSDRQGLGDKELSAHLKTDREWTEVKQGVIKLRGARKINCENTQECRTEQ
jgi:hypothetical protein